MSTLTPPAPTERDHLVAALENYTLGDEIGRGSAGVVYLARHEPLKRLVAVKQLPVELMADPELRERFEVEAQILASLRHPHIVQVFDYVSEGGVTALVMELLQGGTIWDQFRNQGVTQRQAVALALAACSATACAHASGVYHRDIKPENLIVGDSGVIKVADFGLAYVVNGTTTKSTSDGRVYGSPAYMAPEQAEGAELGVQTDVYAIGTMLFEMLSGSLPFPGLSTVTSMLTARIRRDPGDLRAVAPQVPLPIAGVVMKAIERERRHRHPSAEIFGVELAAAAASVWGTSWLHDTGIDVQGSPRILHASRTLRLQQGLPDLGADKDLVTISSSVQDEDDGEPEATVKPRFTDRFGGSWRVSSSDLVEMADVRSALRRPVLWQAGTLGAMVITVVLLLSGFWSDGLDGQHSDSITVNDQPIGSASVVEVDLRELIRVEGVGDVSDDLRLKLSLLDVEVADLAAERGDDGVATFDPGPAANLVSGRLSAELVDAGDGRPTLISVFGVRASNHPLFSVVGVAVVVLLLYSLNRLNFWLKVLAVQRPSMYNLSRLGMMGALLGTVAAIGTNVMFGNSHALSGAIAVGVGALVASVLGGMAASLLPQRPARR